MSSKLLNAEREEHGLAGRINHDFDRLRKLYGRCWTPHWRRARPFMSSGLG